MKIVVTGAGGFIGTRLARALEALGSLRDSRIDRIVLADRVLPETGANHANDGRVTAVQGDVADPGFAARLIDADTRVVFHLAGVVSGAAEADFALGMRANLDGTRSVLEACRAVLHPARPVRVVYASSIAVFGRPLPAAIDDVTQARPTLSYGTQKLVCELLLADYARRGFVDACALRLPGIVVRPPLPPGFPSGALSVFNSDLIREPLAGRDYTAPVGPEAVIWVQSIRCCVENLIHAAQLPDGALGICCSLNLPCVTASVGEIAAALGRAAAARVHYLPDPELQAQFGAWPREFRADRALALGFTADASIDAIVRDHVESPSPS